MKRTAEANRRAKRDYIVLDDDPPPSPSDEVAELRQQLKQSDEKFHRLCNLARRDKEALKAKLVYLEALIDSKDDIQKKPDNASVEDELNKKLSEVSRELEEERQRSAEQQKKLVHLESLQKKVEEMTRALEEERILRARETKKVKAVTGALEQERYLRMRDTKRVEEVARALQNERDRTSELQQKVDQLEAQLVLPQQQPMSGPNLDMATGSLDSQHQEPSDEAMETEQLKPIDTATSLSSVVAPAAQSDALICEICDEAQMDNDGYLQHLQSQHQQLKHKCAADMQIGVPLACSRCGNRFWTGEGLERHLVMCHGLVTSDLLAKAQKNEDGGRCLLCAKYFEFNMLKHLVFDHKVKLCSADIMYSCDVCSFKCLGYTKLEEHLSLMHLNLGNNSDD